MNKDLKVNPTFINKEIGGDVWIYEDTHGIDIYADKFPGRKVITLSWRRIESALARKKKKVQK